MTNPTYENESDFFIYIIWESKITIAFLAGFLILKISLIYCYKNLKAVVPN
ncbi:hypothetical protein SAMN05444387_0378 [Flavobacterium pectinovorum]|uniref:Uncharacterized protein n=1 Tax=Flavobacterium pectinovorum TaxID=29533 RepID=A0ABY1IXV1_9FLAO|nr:hypothetical protein SAMN05444387_0378 [Flavobacterium pectinovorum]